ncbi:transcription factor PAP1-domain-containing protein [Cercophora newfieldiana]|uniref:Transcription factor PAP1-domain-containing protein n=1 Tax=Cercophora newfieldiana TaxID=92897 RepID=A0AA40CJY1_9PEZI|nr:transcription factor PAP1-domain-containing protein [Cercophora newfieldiana]
MTSTKNPLSNFILTPQQQNLLYAALNSNRTANNQTNSAAVGLSPMSFNASPSLGLDKMGSFQNSPDLDYDYDFTGADSSFDYSMDNIEQPRMIGDLPGSSVNGRSESAETESPDKRSHPDDDDEEEPNGAKRRESEDKVAKKPGRKPLTTEPSSKRKAQNRAAQRAFRERKEKHLKDLETKVEELEQASQAANHENELLRAKVDKMTVELNEYKKRLSNMPSTARGAGPIGPFGAPLTRGINDVNFQFEFPKFGLQGTSSTTEPKTSPPSKQGSRGQLSPTEKPTTSSRANSGTYNQNSSSDDLSSFSASLFSAPLTNQNIAQASRGSGDSNFGLTGAMSTSSPSASSNSNMGASSSCGTSPEPLTQSPMGFKPIDTLTTIGEESNLGNSPDFDQFSNLNVPDFNWLPQDFQFDPQLFGDYREPQENVLTNGLDDSFFNDAFDVDFTTPYNLPLTAPKKGLIAQIDAAKESDDTATPGQLLTCNKIWYAMVASVYGRSVANRGCRETLQNCPRVQNGDFDLDGLCSDLQKKAKCSGSGAVVDEQDFQVVMKKYLGKDHTDADIKECSERIKA